MMYKPLIFLLSLLSFRAAAQDTTVTASVQGHIFKPAHVDPTDQRVQQLTVPSGFTIQKFAEGLGKPRMLVVYNDSTVYVTRREGDVMLLRDTNGDGKADETKSVWQKDQVHGIALKGKQLYLTTVNEVYRADIKPDGTLKEPNMIMKDLPDGGQHPNRTIEFGPDGKLYVSVGSTCNACDETRDENATLLVADADGKNRKIFARGLRNTIGFDWHPATGALYGLDHGIDWLGDDEQKEELNRLEEGADYGWPYIYGDGKYNPADAPPNGVPYDTYAEQVTNPLMQLPAHCAPLDMIFYRGDLFPEEYRNDAIVTLRGSWNRSKPSGYKVIRIHFDEAGTPTQYTDLVSGFLVDDNQAQFGRVVGLAPYPDGSVLISDDTSGVIYRLSYEESRGQ